MFSTHSVSFLSFSSSLKLSSANSFSLEESKISHLRNGLQYVWVWRRSLQQLQWYCKMWMSLHDHEANNDTKATILRHFLCNSWAKTWGISLWLYDHVENIMGILWETETRCVCETLMPPKHPSLEKHDPDIWSWPLQMTLTLVLGDVYRWDVPSYQIWAL